jgi:hypothetical protein
MLFFRIREYPLNRFFLQSVQLFVFFGVPEVIHFFHVIGVYGPNVFARSWAPESAYAQDPDHVPVRDQGNLWLPQTGQSFIVLSTVLD